MNTAFYEITDSEASLVAEKLAAHRLTFYPGKLGEEAGQGDVEILSIFVDSKIDRKVLDRFSNLRCIVVRATGYDNVDLAACRDRGIVVCNVPAYGVDTVAEFTFALILALSRKIVASVERVKEEGRFDNAELCGVDLSGKTMGIFGLGHIGSRVAKIARGFNMHVVAYDPLPKRQLAKDLGCEYMSFNQVASSSDVISVHMPYTHNTHHIFNKDIFSSMPAGCLFINTSRGGLVDTESLLEALLSGHLGGAGLDVLEYEGLVRDEMELLSVGKHPNAEEIEVLLADHALTRLPNVLITPHMAYYTVEAMQRILLTTVENVEAFADGKAKNIVFDA